MRKFISNYYILALILLAGAMLRLVRLGTASLFFDELYNIRTDELPLRELLDEAVAAGHPPLYYLISRIWYLFGTGELWARGFSVVAGMVTLILVYLVGRELFSMRVALLGTALTAFSPPLVWFSRAVIYYSWVIPITMLSLYFLVRCARRGGTWNWLGYTIATAAAFLIYFYAAALLLAQGVVYWLLRDRGKSGARSWLVSQAVLIPVMIGSYLYSQSAISVGSTEINIPSLGTINVFLKGIAAAPAVLIGGEGVDGTIGGRLSLSVMFLIAILVLVLALAVLAIGRLRRLYSRSTLAIALFSFIIVACPLALQYMIKGDMLGRYYVWAVPSLMLLVASILAAAPRRLFLVSAASVLIGLFALTLTVYGDKADSDWRQIVSTISTNRLPGDQLLCFHLHSCLVAYEYYEPEAIPISGGFLSGRHDEVFFLPEGEDWQGYSSGYWVGSGATPPLTGEALADKVSRDISEADRLWLVSYEALCNDYPSVCRALDEKWQETSQWDFLYIKLRLLERK